MRDEKREMRNARRETRNAKRVTRDERRVTIHTSRITHHTLRITRHALRITHLASRISHLSMVFVFLFFSFLPAAVGAKTLPPNFKVTNEMIYQKLIEIEKRQAVFEERFKQIDRRFEQIDRRFEQIDRRFEQVDKRFEELRTDMNRRFEEMRADMDKRFEEMNKRFEEMNKRFDDMFHYLNILAGIFTTLTVFVIGFAYWDRRTIISKAKEETIREIENSGKLRDLILVLREKARTDSELERILKEHKLL